MRRPSSLPVLGALLAALVALPAAAADTEPEPLLKVMTLPAQPGPHAFWLSDIMLHRTAMFDGDSGALLGTITSGTAGVGFVVAPLFSADHREIYLAETYYARGVRGERTDVLTVYDGRTLQPTAEVPLPPHRAEFYPGNAANALSDDGRFVAVFNLTPVTSLSIVDVQARTFVGEVATPGCSLVYAAGPRRFFMLCANGGALTVTLDDAGAATVARTEPFFDPKQDPITEKAVRRGNEWLFVSYDGTIHPVDVGGAQLAFGPTWSLLDDDDRRGSWRIGGAQHLTVHAASGTLYALMHQGGPDTHKAAGTEVWAYDLATKRRVRRLPVANALASFVDLQYAAEGGSRLGRFTRWVLDHVLPNPGVDRILVTQDAHPVLVESATLPPALTLHDATTGAVVREVSEPGLAGSLLFTP